LGCAAALESIAFGLNRYGQQKQEPLERKILRAS
jgi:hypothetical protein